MTTIEKEITFHLKGNWETRDVWLNGKKLSPSLSQKIHNHSPDGFNWSYGGSGSAQLALAICLELFGHTFKQKKGWERLHFSYQDFKWKYIAALPASDFDQDITATFKIFQDE